MVPEDGLTQTGMSYDNTGGLGASTWRHVAFIEQIKRPGEGPDGDWQAGGGIAGARTDGGSGARCVGGR